jgi:hypothetical protein
MTVTTPTTQAANQTSKTSLLERAIQVDIGFILVISLAFIAFSAPLAALSGIPANVALILGVACLGYAGFLWWGMKNMPMRQLGWINVALGFVWVAASIVLLFSGWLPLTTLGFWLVVFLAVDVDLISSVQAYALVKRK